MFNLTIKRGALYHANANDCDTGVKKFLYDLRKEKIFILITKN